MPKSRSKKATEMGTTELRTVGRATDSPPTPEVTDTAGLHVSFGMNCRNSRQDPVRKVSPVLSNVQHKIGHRNLRSLPSRSPRKSCECAVENVVKVRPSSASIRGNRAVKSAKGPPSPTGLPNSSAKPTYFTSGTKVIAQIIAEIPPITSSSEGASPLDDQIPFRTYKGDVP